MFRSDHRAQQIDAVVRKVAAREAQLESRFGAKASTQTTQEHLTRPGSVAVRVQGRELGHDVIARVRDHADLVAIVGEFVDLRRTGSDFRGPCPLHDGTRRNFSVNAARQLFYCFVCHAGGDVFTFYMRRFGLTFREAVREVARKVGVSVSARAESHDPNEPLYTIVSLAADWYARQLRESPSAEPARRHLQARDVNLDLVGQLGLGFLPRGDAFVKAMKRMGVTRDMLVDSGLAVLRDGALRPRFSDRLLFPICNPNGRLVGFGGRVLGDASPKYINSPNSPIFQKGKLLYHLHAARIPIRRLGHAVIVEGYFDVLRLVVGGFDHVVAALGTGLTPHQARVLAHIAPSVTILYDGDTSGLRATFRAALALLRVGVTVNVGTLPRGEDPDTLVRRGGIIAVEHVVNEAVDVLDRQLDILEQKGWLESIKMRRRALDRLLPTLCAAHDPVTRDLYINRTAERLTITPESLANEVAEYRP